MTEFLQALSQHAFLQTALLAGLLAALGCGVVGTFVVVKRITFLAGGIAHSVLGGMGAALYFGLDPLGGALAAALVSALLAVAESRKECVVMTALRLGCAFRTVPAQARTPAGASATRCFSPSESCPGRRSSTAWLTAVAFAPWRLANRAIWFARKSG
mgnify:CR=1 FL=1